LENFDCLPSAIVAIGDKTFDLVSRYKYVFDLAEEWFKFTKLPFVFACWVSVKKLPDDIVEQFSKAMAFGVANKVIAVTNYPYEVNTDPIEYVEKYISYELDGHKRKALEKFLDYI